MKQLKVAALYYATQHMDYLENSVQSICSSVELILIGVNGSSGIDQEDRDRFENLSGPARPCEIVRGDWSNPMQCLSALAVVLASRGFSHALLMDPQDVFCENDLSRILSFVEAHPETGQFQVRFNAYWKSPLHRIEPLDPESRTIISKVSASTTFLSLCETSELPIVAIREDVARGHSLAFASPTALVVQRLQAAGLTREAIAPWKKQVWDVWNQKPLLRNLHPGSPSRFRGTTRINACTLPQALAGHPYLEYEVALEEPKRKPACSLIFVANCQGVSLQEFLRKLAATAPDDCEIVGCAPTAAAVSMLQEYPGVKVILISESAELWAAWIEGSKAATTDNLVFLTARTTFENDWVEGFIAAFEQGPSHTVYAARTVDSGPCGDSGDDHRKLLFEKQRGRRYGQRTVATHPFPLRGETCWACTRATLAELGEGTEPASTRYVFLEDTLVFDLQGTAETVCELAGEKQATADKPGSEDDRPLRASIVIPVYNNLHLTKACLDSIFRTTHPGTYELIVVDNGSTDGSREYLESLQPRIRYLRNRRNIFFARGCNRGAWAASGENIVFLNNDTLVKTGWLDELLRPVDRDETIGIVGNKQLFPPSHPVCANRVWHAGMVINTDKLPWHVYYGFDPGHPLVNREHDCPAVSGCCLLIRSELFERLGGFDTQFQNGLEDVDLCLRAGELDYRIVYTPRSEIVHFVSRTESRFDRDAANLERFNNRWRDRLIPNELETYREAGLLPPASSPRTTRVGVVSTFDQKCPLSVYAEQLLAEYPQDSYLVLGEFGIRDRQGDTDPPYVVRCWDRLGTWYYPLLRWLTTLDLDLIHVNFSFSLFPPGFIELLTAVKNAGKRFVVTFHETTQLTPLLAGISQLADAVIVNSPPNRLELILNGCDASKIHVIPPGVPNPSAISRQQARKRLRIPEGRRLIVSNGFVGPEKGILETIAAVSEVRKDLDVHYLVLGGVPPDQSESARYLEQCKSAARKLGIEKYVLFFEDCPREEQNVYLASADAAVLFHQTGRSGSSADAALALATARRVVTSTDPAFMVFGDAVLRAGNGIALAQALRSVLTNPLVGLELSRQAASYQAANSWKKSADLHWNLYRQVLQASGVFKASPLAQYQDYLSKAYSTDISVKLYSQLSTRIRGDTIEFGSRSLELTQWIQPRVSVTSSAELASLAKLLDIEVPVLTLDEFKASPFTDLRFDTIVLHMPDCMDPSVSMVLAFLPHLSDGQRLLVLVHETELHASKLAERFHSRGSARFHCDRERFEPGYELIEISAATERLLHLTSVSPQLRPLTWSSSFYGHGSGDDAARAMALALSDEGLDLGIEATGEALPSVDGRTSFLLGNLERSVSRGGGVRIDQHPANMWERRAEAAWNVARCQPFGDRLSDKELSRLRGMDAVWVSNRFHFEACVRSGLEETKLFTVPNTLYFRMLEKAAPPPGMDGLRSFNFLSILPWEQRAGWDVLVQGFLEEFGVAEDVALVLVIDQPCAASAKAVYDQLSRFVRSRLGRDLSAARNIVLLAEPLGLPEIAQLYKICQAFVLPCRSSRWETPIMSAMASGLPVIATSWGPHMDFMRSENSYPIECEVHELPAAARKGRGVNQELHGAEPSLTHLRALMRHVSLLPEDVAAKSILARREIYEQYSWAKVAVLLRGQLNEIEERLRQPRRLTPMDSTSRPRVCWEGPQLVNHSLALVNREMELGILESGRVDLTILPVGPDNFGASLSARTRVLPTHYGRQFAAPIEIHVRHQWPPNWIAPAQGRWVVIQPWEYGSLPEEWVTKVNSEVDEVWAPSNFVRECYIQSGVEPARVRVVPNGVDADFFRPGLNPYPLACGKSFKFLFLGGTIHRKGIDILLKAYRQAFSAADDVALIVKDMGVAGIYQGQGIGESIVQSQSDPESARILYLDQDLTDVEIARLYNACDCLVHPYRGEGFGLPVLEAMACELPVIVTAGGATDDFVDDSCGFLTPARKQIFGNRVISNLKTAGDLWLLEPDADALAEILARVFRDREQARLVGRQARAKVIKGWTWRHARDKALERIEQLRTAPVLRSLPKFDAAVLVDLGETIPFPTTESLLESLDRNSYARLRVFLRVVRPDTDLNQLLLRYPNVEVLDGVDFDAILHRIRQDVLAPSLALVTSPLRFSKHWLKQLTDVAVSIGRDAKIVVPSTNIEGSMHFVAEQGGTDDFSFQRFSRNLWRSQRGRYEELDSAPSGCAVLNWECLSLADSPRVSDWPEWAARLRRQGVRTYWAKDTFVGLIPVPAGPVEDLTTRNRTAAV